MIRTREQAETADDSGWEQEAVRVRGKQEYRDGRNKAE